MEEYLHDENGAYRRLRRVMDAWNALWIWPLVGVAEGSNGETIQPPSLDEWIKGLTDIRGVHSELKVSGKYNKVQSEAFPSVTTWDELARVATGHRVGCKFTGLLPLGTRLCHGVCARRL